MNNLNRKGFGAIAVVLLLLVVGAVGLVGWKVLGSNPDSTQGSTQTTSGAEREEPQQPEPKKLATGTIITTGDSEFGTMLFNNKKQAIYIWELEESKKAECYGDCAEAWPPVLTDGAPRAAGSVKDELLGTTKRSDGTTQVTYNGRPLYYYAHEGPGEVECHNISTHGGLWWVIQPNGKRAS